jgi:hypothetical protein
MMIKVKRTTGTVNGKEWKLLQQMGKSENCYSRWERMGRG